MLGYQKQNNIMAKTSIKSIIDDILLLVRNNNISESEDLSRAQILLWILAYKRAIWKERKDKFDDLLDKTYKDLEDLLDDDFLQIKEIGPLELEDVEPLDGIPTYTKRTVDEIDNVFNNIQSSILAVHDESGENIQLMNHIRRHYHYFRKYTAAELTAFYQDDRHIYIQGTEDQNKLRHVWVRYLYEIDNAEDDEDNGDDIDEDDIMVPDWMVPLIKRNIINNELAFMLNRPSDDSNNATLASVKPYGPQDQEK